MNAQACVEAGAAYLVADADVEGPEFARKLRELIEDEDVRARMTAAARAQKTRDAGRRGHGSGSRTALSGRAIGYNSGLQYIRETEDALWTPCTSTRYISSALEASA